MQHFFVNSGRKTKGPFGIDEIRTLVRTGKLRPDDTVWSAEEDRWIEVAQLDRVRGLFAGGREEQRASRKILALASGKGGVGKTVLSASIASALAALGHRVLLVDGDWGGPDVHVQFGILELPVTQGRDGGRSGTSGVLVETPVPNLHLLCAEPGVLGAAQPNSMQRLRFVRQILQADADYVILDLAAGTNYLVLDLFLSADLPIVVATPDPMSLHEAFNLVKIALLRRVLRLHGADSDEWGELAGNGRRARQLAVRTTVPELLQKLEKTKPAAASRLRELLAGWRPQLILNMVRDSRERKEAGALQIACEELLGVQLGYLGHVDWDPRVREAVQHYRPFILYDPDGPAARSLAKLIAVRLLGKQGLSGFFARRRVLGAAEETAAEMPADAAQSEVICSYRCSYWGDCEFQNGGHPCPVRQFEPVFRTSQGTSS